MRPRSQGILAESLEDYILQLNLKPVNAQSDSTLIQLYNFDSLSLNQTNDENNNTSDSNCSVDLLASNVSYRIKCSKFEKATEELISKTTKRLLIPLKVKRAQLKKKRCVVSLIEKI